MAGLLVGRSGPMLIAIPSSVAVLIIHVAQLNGQIPGDVPVQALQYQTFFLIFMLLLTAWLGSQSLSNLNHLLRRAQSELDERLEVEAALRENQIRYKALYERTNDMVFIISLDGIYLASNARAQEFLGYKDEDMLGRHYMDFIATEDQGLSHQRSQDLLEGDLLPVYERRMRHKDGSIQIVEISAATVYDQEGQPLHIQSVLRDITKRKQTEQDITRMAAELESLHEISLEISKQLDLDKLLDLIVERALTLLNAEFGRLFQKSEDSDELYIAAVFNGQEDLLGFRLPEGQGFAGRIVLERSSAKVLDYQNWEHKLDASMGFEINQIAGAPLQDAAESLGVLVVFDQEQAESFESIDLKLLERLANQAVIAIQNAMRISQVREQAEFLEDRVKSRTADLAMANQKLAEEVDDRVEAQEHLVSALTRTEALNTIGKLLITGDHGPRLLDQVVERLAKLLNATEVQLVTFDLEQQHINEFAIYTLQSPHPHRPSLANFIRGLNGWVIRNGQAAGAVADHYFPATVPAADMLGSEAQPGSLMIAPIFSGAAISGTITVKRDPSDVNYTEDDLIQFGSLTDQIAIALERTALLERLQTTNEQLKRSLNLMAGRELRMRELKDVVQELSLQLESLGHVPGARDPLDVRRFEHELRQEHDE